MFDQYTAFKFLKRVGRSPLFWLGGPLLLYAWAIPGPFVFDDLNLLRKTERYIGGDRDRLDLFRFAPTDEDWLTMRSRGTYPWWSPDEHRIDFQRPLAEWSFWLDVKVFGRNPIGPRIESLALFLIALILVHQLFRSVEADPLRAGVATFFLGVSQCLAQPVTFISNRSDLFVLIGVALAAAAYFRLGRRPRLSTAIVGLAGFVFALLSKEPAVALAGVIVGHALIASRRQVDASARAAQCGYAAAIAMAAVGYVIWYLRTSQAGAGAMDADRFLSMGRHFLLYADVWAIGLPIAILPYTLADLTLVATIAGAISWMAIARIVHRQWRNRRPDVLFFALWILAFIAPALLTIPESRALSIATVGWAWLLAGLLLPNESTDRPAGAPSIWTRQWFLAVNGIVSICCGIGTIYLMQHFELQSRDQLRRVVTSLDTPLEDGNTLVILEAESPYELICAGDRLAVVSQRNAVHAIFLTLAGADATLTSIGQREFLIRGTAPRLFDTPTHRLTLGNGYRPQVGDAFPLAQMTFEIAELNDAGNVTAIRLRIHDDADLSTIKTYPRGLFSDPIKPTAPQRTPPVESP